MERTAWPDERLDDAFGELRADMRELRRELHAEMSQVKLLMLGQTVAIMGAILAAVLPLYLR